MSYFLRIALLIGWMSSGTVAYAQGEGELERCDAGDADACNAAALYQYAAGNHEASAELLARACDTGLAVACSNLAEQYFDGIGVQRDLQRSFDLFKQGCGANVVSGCAGMCLVAAESSQLNEKLQSACESALAESCNRGNRWMCEKDLSVAAASLPQVSSPESVSDQCEGAALERTTQLVQSIWHQAFAIGASVDDFASALQAMTNLIEHTNQEASSLPAPCQVTLHQWLEAISAPTPDEGTMCHGSVCCDDSGCYGG